MVLLVVVWGWGPSPAAATVAGDMAKNLPLEKVIANGLGAGLAIETILAQALDAGADPCALLKAALQQGVEMARVFKFFRDRGKADPEFARVCGPCVMMKCAVDAGKDQVEAANAMMSAGEQLETVRSCLAGLGYAGASTYTYTPPGVPPVTAPPAVVPPVVAPPFPGGGGGGGAPPIIPPVASPAM